MQTVTLYRAVSLAEYTQLTQTGRFEIVGNSVEGKYFAESISDAAEWGNRLYGSDHYRIVVVVVPVSVTSAFYRLERLDGIGPARFADMVQLEGAIISIREATE